MNIDSLVLDQSLATTPDNIEFVGKKWVYCNDSNASSYSGGTVLIDSTQITNSGAFNNISEGFLLIPLVIQLTSATTASLPANTFLADNVWALKDGFQMINSLSVEYNGTNVVQESPYINIYNSFKAKTTWSWNDVYNDGPSSIFFPDNASSWQYSSTNATNSNLSSGGVGLQNNRDTPSVVAYTGGPGTTATTATPSFGASPVAGIPTGGEYSGIPAQNSFIGCPTSYNDGFAMRKYYTNYDPNDSTTLNQGAINGANSCASNYRNYKNTTGSTAGSVVWMAYLKLRLKDLGDFFQQVPLVKGGTFRIRLTTNQCITQFTTTLATITAATGVITAYPTLVVNSTTITAGLTNPLQIASAGLGQGCSALAADTYNLSVSIYRNNNSTQTTVQNVSNPLSSIRLYVPVYTFNPIVESNYITMNSQRKILYNDIFQYQFTGIGAGSSFNFLVSNGIPNIQTVVVVPLISQASGNGVISTTTAGVTTTSSNIGTLLSPCCNTGASSDPLQITNFQIQISGQNLFMENEYYDFQQFMEELRSVNQLNGSITTGLTSGLINEFQFSRGMRYYVGNASRILPSEKGVTRAVNITGLNSSLLAMDIYVFVVFQKSITINCATGQVLAM